MAPVYLGELLPDRIEARTSHNLRNRSQLQIPYARLETYRRSFFPRVSAEWNSLDDDTKAKPSLESFKSVFKKEKDPTHKLLYYGQRWPSIHHARMWMGCSKLNQHLSNNLRVIPSPECQCGHRVEDPTHFFFHCPLFDGPREKLFNDIHNIPLGVEVDTDMLLHGDPSSNMEIWKLTERYSTQSTPS